jgi:beta-glucosidase
MRQPDTTGKIKDQEVVMRHSKLWTGLASITSFMLILSVLGFQTLNFYSATVNQTLGIETSRVQNPEGTDVSELMYYKSDYGELNSENLQKLIADTYAESAGEGAEGAFLRENRPEALPFPKMKEA